MSEANEERQPIDNINWWRDEVARLRVILDRKRDAFKAKEAENKRLREVVERLVAMVAHAHRGSLDKPCGCNWCVSNWHTYTSIAREAAEKKGREGATPKSVREILGSKPLEINFKAGKGREKQP